MSVFYLTVVLISALKLYCIAGRDIIAMPWDSYQYFWMSDALYWHNDGSLARRPVFPLFLALSRNTGIPLRLIFESLFIFSAFRMSSAVIRLGTPILVATIAFALTVFTPYSIECFDFAMVECLLVSILLLCTSELCYVFSSRGRSFWLHLCLFAVSVTLGWYSRSESALFLLAIFSEIFFCSILLYFRRSEKTLLFKNVSGFLATSVAVAIATLAVYSLNIKYFNYYSSVEIFQSKAFVRAYDAMQGLHIGKQTHFVPFSNEQMALASQLSPTFAKMYPSLQGKVGDTFRNISRNQAGVSEEIAGGWLLWALTEAAQNTGALTMAARQEVYRKVGAELEAGAKAQHIAIDRFPLALVDPHWRVWLPYFPASLSLAFRRLVPGHHPQNVLTQGVVPPEITQEFDRDANRRTALTVPGHPDEKSVRAGATLRFLASAYRPAVAVFLLVTLGFVAVFRKQVFQYRNLCGLLFISTLALLRVVLVALLDASAYPTGGIDRYMLPSAVLVPFMIALAFPRRRDYVQPAVSGAERAVLPS
ncbi:hypothetical protein [Acetobacter oeni]|uniref:Glycosyltransferase RgtA/B/C/D-like domain-containing protein n=1 Tax=Acetobacter oeni TaxID=304077 RepID=A0A511XNY2_9PROT|nr:hypothetical protein [Acetobacter oeni]MBB3881631.1 hypothetical protein [Acetobacter oeni]NHO17559.1 hypothetical protein [Acetobacter oeni]GEN64614.1 hypothetical protein AOE01nite_28380 [Acetobacter oeni]